MAGRSGTKLFYRIGEVSRLAGVEPYILRYWESEFPALSPKKGRGGQRVYQQKDLDLVLSIKRMLHEEGYTIAGAKKKLAAGKTGNPDDARENTGREEAGEGLADALGRFREEIKDILDLIK